MKTFNRVSFEQVENDFKIRKNDNYMNKRNDFNHEQIKIGRKKHFN